MREVGRIDDHVGPLAQWSEQPPVGLDGFVDGAGREKGWRRRVWLKRRTSRSSARIEEEHARVVAGDDAIDRGAGIAQAPVAAKVERDCHVATPACSSAATTLSSTAGGRCSMQ